MMASIRYNRRKNRESVRKRLGKRAAARIDERDGFRCVYCKLHRDDSEMPMTIDHLTPRSRGGTDELHNLVTACWGCNSERQGLNLTAWCRVWGICPRAVRRAARRLP